MTDERMIDKVTKLLAKAERAGTAEEAEAFFAKAQELMTRWGIEDAQLQARGTGDDEIVEDSVALKTTDLEADAQLWVAISGVNGVKNLLQRYQPGEPGRIYLIGWRSDVERTKLMFTAIHAQLAHETRRYRPADRVARRSFRVGYASRIRARLAEQDHLTRRHVEDDAPGTGLVLRDRRAAVEDFFDRMAKGEARAPRWRTNGHAMSEGRRAADRADLGNTRLAGQRGLGRGK